MALTVHELFATLQGEGSRAGQPAVFVRLAGCNLWSGMEDTRHIGRGDCSAWCDTKFVGGDLISSDVLARRIFGLAKEAEMIRPLVVFSGGEPLLQLARSTTCGETMDLMKGLRDGGAEIALETNGTLSIPSWLVDYFDHVTVSPKGRRGAPASTEHLKFVKANDLKIVVPCPMAVEDLLSLYTGASLYLQPRDDGGDVGAAALDEARLLAARHGGRVSIQVHKLLGLP